jgi:hypothetical protein
MSRALNVDATIDQVLTASTKQQAAISTIEPLVPSGTRVVFVRSEDARAMERVFGNRILHGPVTRRPIRPAYSTQ